jgi:hypothetical protein
MTRLRIALVQRELGKHPESRELQAAFVSFNRE